jgi:hypothetical protein
MFKKSITLSAGECRWLVSITENIWCQSFPSDILYTTELFMVFLEFNLGFRIQTDGVERFEKRNWTTIRKKKTCLWRLIWRIFLEYSLDKQSISGTHWLIFLYLSEILECIWIQNNPDSINFYSLMMVIMNKMVWMIMMTDVEQVDFKYKGFDNPRKTLK